MSLPYGSDPKDSNIYRELSSIQLKDLTQDEFETQIKGIFIDAPQEDDLRRVILVGHSTGQLGGSAICSNSQVVQAFDLQENTKKTILEPATGERFGLQAFSISDLGGRSRVDFRVEDASGNSCPLFRIAGAGSADTVSYEGKGFVLTYPNKLTAQGTGTTTSDVEGDIVYSAVR